MNQDTTIQELLDNCRNVSFLIKNILAAYYGIEVDKITLERGAFIDE